MIIRSSDSIRNNYNEISDLCKKNKEPVFLTKNGELDLVVMDLETYNRREKQLKLKEELLAVEKDKLNGSVGYSVTEVAQKMKKAIESLSDKDKEEYEIWYADHIKEILEATQKMTNRLDLEDEDLEVEEW